MAEEQEFQRDLSAALDRGMQDRQRNVSNGSQAQQAISGQTYPNQPSTLLGGKPTSTARAQIEYTIKGMQETIVVLQDALRRL